MLINTVLIDGEMPGEIAQRIVFAGQPAALEEIGMGQGIGALGEVLRGMDGDEAGVHFVHAFAAELSGGDQHLANSRRAGCRGGRSGAGGRVLLAIARAGIDRDDRSDQRGSGQKGGQLTEVIAKNNGPGPFWTQSPSILTNMIRNLLAVGMKIPPLPRQQSGWRAPRRAAGSRIRSGDPEARSSSADLRLASPRW